jgi:hypothetical protein
VARRGASSPPKTTSSPRKVSFHNNLQYDITVNWLNRATGQESYIGEVKLLDKDITITTYGEHEFVIRRSARLRTFPHLADRETHRKNDSVEVRRAIIQAGGAWCRWLGGWVFAEGTAQPWTTLVEASIDHWTDFHRCSACADEPPRC